MQARSTENSVTLDANYNRLLALCASNKLQLGEAIGRAWLAKAFCPPMQVVAAFALAALDEEGVGCTLAHLLSLLPEIAIEKATWLFLQKVAVEGRREVD